MVSILRCGCSATCPKLSKRGSNNATPAPFRKVRRGIPARLGDWPKGSWLGLGLICSFVRETMALQTPTFNLIQVGAPFTQASLAVLRLGFLLLSSRSFPLTGHALVIDLGALLRIFVHRRLQTQADVA